MPPKPPHHKPPKPGRPDQEHLEERKLDLWHLFSSILIGSGLALGIGFILYFIGIETDVILPVLAPIWVGAITVSLTLFKKRK
jgi:hypothetical protein